MSIANTIKRIEAFNVERHLIDKGFNPATEISFIKEESSELFRNYKDENELVDALADISVFAVGAIKKLNQQLDATKIVYNSSNLITLETEAIQTRAPDFDFTLIYNLDSVEVNDLLDTLIEQSGDYYSQQIGEMIEILKDTYNDDILLIKALFASKDISHIVTGLIEGSLSPNVEIRKAFTTYYFGKLFIVAQTFIRALGYDFNIIMDEVLKHIESREGSYNEVTGKWEKNKSQDPATLYQPDFSRAKLN